MQIVPPSSGYGFKQVSLEQSSSLAISSQTNASSVAVGKSGDSVISPEPEGKTSVDVEPLFVVRGLGQLPNSAVNGAERTSNNIKAELGNQRGAEAEGPSEEKKTSEGITGEFNPEPGYGDLSEQELRQIEALSARDREVRAHERAHQSVGGQYTGAVSYGYQTGANGKRYAISGEVPIDVSPVQGNPQATIEKMRVVKSAALAPADPSAQDKVVAATASRLLLEAQAALAAERQESSAPAEKAEKERDYSKYVSNSYEEIIGLVDSEGLKVGKVDEIA